MNPTYFCPFCGVDQPGNLIRDGKRTKICCKACGSPLGEVRPGTAAGPAAAPPPSPKVLCIDDDRLLLALFTDTLEGHNFRAITATDGPSGIEVARKERPDVVLVDVMMPKMSGFDVCRQMRADPVLRRTPIIILTAMADPRLKEKGLEAGANLAMQKPFDPNQLIGLIRKALAIKAKR